MKGGGSNFNILGTFHNAWISNAKTWGKRLRFIWKGKHYRIFDVLKLKIRIYPGVYHRFELKATVSCQIYSNTFIIIVRSKINEMSTFFMKNKRDVHVFHEKLIRCPRFLWKIKEMSTFFMKNKGDAHVFHEK